MTLDSAAAAALGTVRVVGTGLLGASIGLALRPLGVPVLLWDASPTTVGLAQDLGAGTIGGAADGDPQADLVVVCVPPDVTAAVVDHELRLHPRATVTDVASVKQGVLDRLAVIGADLTRYVGAHPMAGRERSGPLAARSDLFLGRPWVVCAGKADQARVEQVRALARALGASAHAMSAAEHDQAVAVVSHLPQLVASLMAARLVDAGEDAVDLAGPGVRDVTRIADSDPLLWAQILAANAAAVLPVAQALRADLDQVLAALTALGQDGAAAGARAVLAGLVSAGRAGREQIPGKHGGRATAFATVTVLLPDRPGQLGRLFDDVGRAGINIEEFSLEHAPGQPVGRGELSVLPAAREQLEQVLTELGWRITG